MKNLFLAVSLILYMSGNAFAQQNKGIRGEIVNGKATYLPIPDYPQEAKDFCVDGKVEVEYELWEQHIPDFDYQLGMSYFNMVVQTKETISYGWFI